MGLWSRLILLILCATTLQQVAQAAGGITPEQIYQPRIEWENVMGTWEVLPEQNPLSEKGKPIPQPSHRTLMTLRKDGTCRVFNADNPLGRDGMWTVGEHEMFMTFPDGSKIDFYVYGVKGDFMITLSPIEDGQDQLWSRVK